MRNTCDAQGAEDVLTLPCQAASTHGPLSCSCSGCCFPTASPSLQLPVKGLKTDSHASSLRSWHYYCFNTAISPAGRPVITNSKQAMRQLPFTLLCLRPIDSCPQPRHLTIAHLSAATEKQTNLRAVFVSQSMNSQTRGISDFGWSCVEPGTGLDDGYGALLPWDRIIEYSLAFDPGSSSTAVEIQPSPCS